MSPPHIDEHPDLRVKHDRFPPCLLPPLRGSRTTPTLSVSAPVTQFGSVIETQFLPEREWHESGHHVDPLTVCKAAWILTLQRFVQADVLCFAYQEAAPPSCSNSTGIDAVLYFTRVDGNEEAQDFLTRLGGSTPSVVLAAPRGHEIRIVKGQLAAGAFGNTMLYYSGEGDGGTRPRALGARKPSGVSL
jgi:hypothetical protein